MHTETPPHHGRSASFIKKNIDQAFSVFFFKLFTYLLYRPFIPLDYFSIQIMSNIIYIYEMKKTIVHVRIIVSQVEDIFFPPS